MVLHQMFNCVSVFCCSQCCAFPRSGGSLTCVVPECPLVGRYHFHFLILLLLSTWVASRFTNMTSASKHNIADLVHLGVVGSSSQHFPHRTQSSPKAMVHVCPCVLWLSSVAASTPDPHRKWVWTRRRCHRNQEDKKTVVSLGRSRQES